MDKFSELKAAAMAATPQQIDGAQEKTEDGCMECPCCSGEGRVDVGADYCNYDNTAIGVIFYGIGDAHVAAERYFRAANPSTVLALLAELEAKDNRIAELERANTSQDDHINQQQDRIESLEKTNAGLGRRLGDAEKRLATPVRLPRPACTYADHSYPAYSRKQVEEIITSAGMRVTVEGDD
ncbi:ead/Ea22-like family protein [Serratia sp. H402Y]|uniref:ead/Ea22-like family protein n=1 Tax=Serratia sp. H402Y TaxID=3444320 RepID=UPI003EC13E85